MNWQSVISMKLRIIASIKVVAAKQDRHLTDSEKYEIENFEGQIKRFTTYWNVGMPCFVR